MELSGQINILAVKYMMTSYLNGARLFLSNPYNNPLTSVGTRHGLHYAWGGLYDIVDNITEISRNEMFHMPTLE